MDKIDYLQMLKNSAREAALFAAALKITGLVDGIHVTTETLIIGATIASLLQNLLHACKLPTKPQQPPS